MAEKAKLAKVLILGREVAFRPFNDTQLVLIHRMRQMLSGVLAQLPGDAGDTDREMTSEESAAVTAGLDVMVKFLDMLGYMVVEDRDRDWLTQQMLAGSLDLKEISGFVEHLVPDERKEKAPAKKAVRAR